MTEFKKDKKSAADNEVVIKFRKYGKLKSSVEMAYKSTNKGILEK